MILNKKQKPIFIFRKKYTICIMGIMSILCGIIYKKKIIEYELHNLVTLYI